MRIPLTLFLVLLISASISGQEFECDGSSYYVSTNTVEGSRFYRLQIDGATQKVTSRELPFHNDKKRHITCLGYNVKNKLIYGLDFNTYELLQIGSDGSIKSLGVPENLDTSYEYWSGTMEPDGNTLMVVARDKATGIDKRVYLIRINNPPHYYAGYFSIVSDLPVALTDLTTDPIVGVTYGFDMINSQIVIFSKSGQVTLATVKAFQKVSQRFGSLFFDRQGQLYGLGNDSGGAAEQSTLYTINKSFGNTARLQAISGGRDTDGCSCPYTIEFYKSINPKQTFNCGLVTIDYVVVNKAGIGQVSTHIFDDLPQEFTIVDIEMENMFLVNVNGGIGTNSLDITGWTLVLRENSVRVTAEIRNAEPGILQSQATVQNFPAALNFEIQSDDPLTEEQEDPTGVEILDFDDFHLKDFTTSSCDQDTVFLSMPLSGDFLWNDGSTQPVLPVTEKGEYSVTVTTDCFTISDRIALDLEEEELFVDLGLDRQVRLGDPVFLDFLSNAAAITQIEWVMEGDSTLSCYDCRQPEFIATRDVRLQVTVTDQRGCSVTDELQISVDGDALFFFPNAFSPNADGINDDFFPQGQVGEVVSFRIFDRWGSLLFEQKEFALNDSSGGWNGTYKGRKVTSGVYLWSVTVRLPNNRIEHHSGDVLVIY